MGNFPFAGENWKELALSSDGSLTVKNIRPEQFGTYVCKVSGEPRSYEVLRLSGENSEDLMRSEGMEGKL